MPVEPVLEARNLGKRYGSTWALRGVSFKVGQGLTVVVGPNGSGKSTLLSLAVGVARPSEGSVKLIGRDPRRDRSVVERAGFSPDPPSLPWFSGIGELLDVLVGDGVLDWDRLWEALGVLGLREHLSKRVVGLSAGLRKKLSIAIAYAKKRARVVLLDEPFANLDRRSTRTVSSLIAGMVSRGVSVVIATHIAPKPLPEPDYLVAMSSGSLVSSGSAIEAASRLKALVVEAENPGPRAIERLARIATRGVTVTEKRVWVRGLDASTAREVAESLNGTVHVDLELVLEELVG